MTHNVREAEERARRVLARSYQFGNEKPKMALDYLSLAEFARRLCWALAQFVRAAKYTSGVSLEFATKESERILTEAREREGAASPSLRWQR